MTLLAKFRGTLLGVLVGDACGVGFEDEYSPTIIKAEIVKEDMKKYKSDYNGPPTEFYSDDTAMTKAIAETLICGYTQDKLAKKFAQTYFTDTKHSRNYGCHVTAVFRKIHEGKYTDPTGPAREQFNGSGSFGNGGAMRVSPVALYYWNNESKIPDLARECTEITHGKNCTTDINFPTRVCFFHFSINLASMEQFFRRMPSTRH